MSPQQAWHAVARALVDSILDAQAESQRLGIHWEIDDDGETIHNALWQAQTAFVTADPTKSARAVRALLAVAEKLAPAEDWAAHPVPHLDALRGLLVLVPRRG